MTPSPPVETAEARRKPARRWRFLLFQILMIPVCVGAAELCYRGYLYCTGQSYSIWRAKDSLTRLVAQMDSRIPLSEAAGESRPQILQDNSECLHPYFGIDSLGYIKYYDEVLRYYQSDRAAKEYKIVILGGSVAGMFGFIGGAEFTNTLKSLPSFKGKEVALIPQGRGGFKQPQQLNAFIYLLTLGCVPDAVINLDGFNEVALSMNNADSKVNPAFPSITHWGPHAATRRLELRVRETLDASRERRARAKEIVTFTVSNHLYYSAIFGNITLSRVRKLHLENALATDHYLHEITSGERDPALLGPEFNTNPEEVIRSAVRVWSESSRMIDAICAARGIVYFHALQPTLHDVGSKLLSERERAAGAAPKTYVDGVRLGYPLLKKEGERLRKTGLRFIDMSRVFENVTNDIYVDNCHFGEEGNLILARRLAAEVDAILQKK